MYTRQCFPCLHCHPHSYIRMVHHLIERCLMMRMSREECITALAHHARIKPLVTLTVWRELLKENKEFFQAYDLQALSNPRPFNNGGSTSTVSYSDKVCKKETTMEIIDDNGFFRCEKMWEKERYFIAKVMRVFGSFGT